MRLRRRIVLTLFAAALAASVAPAGGRVSGRGPQGDSRRGDRPGTSTRIVDPRASAENDLWPTFAQSPVGNRDIWVVWSRLVDADYDLVWSRWNGLRWDEIRPLIPESQRGDDLDAQLTFDSSGHLFATWWRNEDGVGRVLVSTFLGSRWSAPVGVSVEGVDSRFPTIATLGPDSVYVRFRSAGQIVSRTVMFSRPTTITDDINPLCDVHDGVEGVQP